MTRALELWSGAVGDAWVARNAGRELPGRARFWHRILRVFRPRSVLEVGCGSGINLGLLEAQQVVGLDVNFRALTVSLPFADSVVAGSAAALPFRSAVFDLVILAGVLMHQAREDLDACMREAARVTRRLIITAEPEGAVEEDLEWRGLRGVLFRRAYGDLWRATCPGLRVLSSGDMSRVAWGDDVRWWVFAR